jgi:hypothetical protein
MIRGRRRRCLLALLILLPLTACASIPESSEVRAVKRVDEGNVSAPVPAPPNDADAFTLVRNFVDAGGVPNDDFASARMYLTGAAGKGWTVPPELLIVDDVETIPVPPPPGTPDGVQIVSLQGSRVGWLKPDQSFVPASGEYEVQVRVERQPNGQWRIATPPRELVTSRKSFTDRYRTVPIYFLDHESNGVVPDLRYLVRHPESTLPRRVVDLLMTGPSEGFRSAMGTALPTGAHPRTNVSEAEDGALVVNLSDLGKPTQETRRLIAAQVVLSLQNVSNARVRLLEDGIPMLANQPELRPSDMASYEVNNAIRPDVPGLVVANERLHILDPRAQPVPGPAGSGEYDVLRAAQSTDGGELAAVVRKPSGGVGLRVGAYGAQLSEVPLAGIDMSRPTWRSRSELWTVVGGRDVVRVLDGGDGRWITRPVNAQEFSGGRPITDLRLSRDGTRVAGVVDGQIVVAGVTDEDGQIVLRRPTVLTDGTKEPVVTGVEWLREDSLVATTNSNSVPVEAVTVDGFERTRYPTTNLNQPISAVTVGPGRKVIVADHNGLWESTGPGDLWRFLQVPIGGGSIPFYPG